MIRLKMESMDKTEEKIEKIAAFFPEVITEIQDETGKVRKGIDFERLKQELSDSILPGEENYAFSWVGKKAAIVESNSPVRKTLRPCIAESKGWENTKNLYIEGDNLDVLKLLQAGYANSIRMIYVDPPYNNGIDFIYRDNYSMDREQYKKHDSSPDFLTEDEKRRRLHCGWCSMMYPRLRLAHALLSENGVIFMSIDDTEIDNLKKMCDEIFGESNFITIIAVEITKTQGMKVKSAKSGSIVKNFEYILCYAKNVRGKKIVKNILYDKNEGYDTHFSYYIEKKGERYQIRKLLDVLKENKEIYEEFIKYGMVNSRGNIRIHTLEPAILISKKIREYIYLELAEKIFQEMACSITLNKEMEERIERNGVFEYNGYLLTRSAGGKLRQFGSLADTLRQNDEYKGEFGRVTIRGNLWKGFYSDMMNVAKEGDVAYKNGKKPVRLIYQLAKWIGVEEEETVMDFFSGSATTAHAVMKLNASDFQHRRYIMVQMAENLDDSFNHAAGEAKKAIQKVIHFLDSVNRPHILSEVGKERILRAGVELEQKTMNRDISPEKRGNGIDTGFRVFKLDSSNMKDAFYSRIHKGSQEPLWKDDRTELDLLFGIMLDLGVELTAFHKIEMMGDMRVHIVNRDDLIACFSQQLTKSVLTEMIKKRPARVVLKESVICPRQEIIRLFREKSAATEIYIL